MKAYHVSIGNGRMSRSLFADTPRGAAELFAEREDMGTGPVVWRCGGDPLDMSSVGFNRDGIPGLIVVMPLGFSN